MLKFINKNQIILILATTMSTALNSGIDEVNNSIARLMDRVEQAFAANLESGEIAREGFLGLNLIIQNSCTLLSHLNTQKSAAEENIKYADSEDLAEAFKANIQEMEQLKKIEASKITIQRNYKMLAALPLSDSLHLFASNEENSQKLVLQLESIEFPQRSDNKKIAKILSNSLETSSIFGDLAIRPEAPNQSPEEGFENILPNCTEIFGELAKTNPDISVELETIYHQATTAKSALESYSPEKDYFNLGAERLEGLVDELNYIFFEKSNEYLKALGVTGANLSPEDLATISKELSHPGIEETKNAILNAQTFFVNTLKPKDSASLCSLSSSDSLGESSTDYSKSPKVRKRDIAKAGITAAWEAGVSSYNWLTGKSAK